MNNKNTTGFAIVLAWPETYCKQSNSWYDPLMKFMHISKHHFYKVGHAAIILIHKNDKICRYFDFGRYHAPLKYGRVRSAITDNELRIETQAQFTKNHLLNFDSILNELQSKGVFHGDGLLHASYTSINFEMAFKKASKMQSESPIIYGPFIPKGTNCSRFVQTVVSTGISVNWNKLKLHLFLPFTPTPISNVKAFYHYKTKAKLYKTTEFIPTKPKKAFLTSTISAPKKNKNVPQSAQWLSGEGYGSWFYLRSKGNLMEATRYSPKGKIECRGLFHSPSNFNLKKDFTITHLSHCQQITVIQNEKEFKFKKIKQSPKMIFSNKIKESPKIIYFKTLKQKFLFQE